MTLLEDYFPYSLLILFFISGFLIYIFKDLSNSNLHRDNDSDAWYNFGDDSNDECYNFGDDSNDD